MLRDKIIAAARTGFSVLGASIVTWVVLKLAELGVVVKVDETWSTILAGAMFAIFVSFYNLGVGWLKDNVWDGFGWLLGVNQAPSYVEADLRSPAAPDDGVAVDAAAVDDVLKGLD